MPAGINSAVSPLTVQTCVHCTLLRTRRDITLCLHCEVRKSENHQRWFKPTHLPQRKPEPRSAWARIHSAGDQRKRRGGAGHHLATSVLRRVTHSHMPLDAEHRKQHTDPFPTSGSSTPPTWSPLCWSGPSAKRIMAPGQRGRCGRSCSTGSLGSH